MRRLRQMTAFGLVVIALAVPGMATAKGELYNCTVLARDGSFIQAAGGFDKDGMQQYKKEFPPPAYRVTCVKY